MQIETTRYYTPIRMVTTNNSGNKKSGKDMEKLDHANIANGNVKWHSLSGNNLSVSYKAKNTTTVQPSIFSFEHSF